MTIAETYAAKYSVADWNDPDVMNEFWTDIEAEAESTVEVPGRGSDEPKIYVFNDDSWFDPKKNEVGNSTIKLVAENQPDVTIE